MEGTQQECFVRSSTGSVDRLKTERARGAKTALWGKATLFLATLAANGVIVPARGHSQPYNFRESVQVIANKVFPYHNPAETYTYYSLPFCRANEDAKLQRERQRFGELLVGDRKVITDYQLNFQQDVEWHSLCHVELTPDVVRAFTDAIRDNYYYELFIDDMPVTGPIGVEEAGEYLRIWHEPKVSLYPHISFTIGYNDDRIVSVAADSREFPTDRSSPTPREVELSDTSGMTVEFTYSVRWVAEDIAYGERMQKMQGSDQLPAGFKIHWLSITNAFVLVVILTVFLGIILMGVVSNDFSRYTNGDEDDIGEEESGWKLVHGDVFRFPNKLNIFAGLTGVGAQLCLATFLLLVCALVGLIRPNRRGSIQTCILVLYSMTAWVSGLVSARLYRQLGGRNWVWNSVTTTLIFPGPLLIVFSILNSVAVSQSSTAAVPFYNVAVIVLVFLFVVFPMTVFGSIVGRHTASDFQAPCRTTRVPRQVPKDVPWYRKKYSQIFMSGFLPFSAIFIELHYIFASVWGHQIYTLFGILCLAFLLLLVVCSFITVALIYLQLATEDHRWWWRSFLCGGSTGFFVYGYSFFYYFYHSEMSGLLQSSFYFGYMAVISYAFFMMLGFVGFMSSLTFVKHIYSVVKCD